MALPNHRQDDPSGPIRITREIPLPWLIGIVAAGFAQAGLVYFKQEAQAKLITDLSSEVRSLTTTLNSKDLKDVEHDLKIADLQRRVLILESKPEVKR